MNGFLLLLPFLLVRFLLLSALNRGAVQRAAYFAPVQGKERTAYYIYQISNIGIFLYLIFLKVIVDFSLWFLYRAGLLYPGDMFVCGNGYMFFFSG